MTDTTADAAADDVAKRDHRGHWAPKELITLPPVLVWPPQPKAFVKWLLGFPGYIWPWNLFYMAIATATWFWLTPPLEQMKTIEWGWVLILFGRNFVLLLFAISIFHVPFYARQRQGVDYKFTNQWMARDNPNFLFKNQLLDNIFWTFASAWPIWTAYEAITLYAFANGWIPYVSWQQHPIYCTVLMIIVPSIRDVHFYTTHRLLHWGPLYRLAHNLHHKNVNVGPWSGLAMHPIEHILYFTCGFLHWIIPSHPLHAIYNFQHAALTPALGHCGFDRFRITRHYALKTGAYIHQLHHRYFECNYAGDGSWPADRWFGSFHNGSEESRIAMTKRVMERRKKDAEAE